MALKATVQIQLRMSPELADRLTAAAKVRGTSRNAMLIEVVTAEADRVLADDEGSET